MLKIEKSRLAIGNYHYVRMSFEYFLDRVVEMGMENIELWAAAPHFDLDTINEKTLTEKKRNIEDRGLKVVCITPEQCSYPINIALKDESIRNRSINYFKTAIDCAKELKSPYVLVTAGCGYFDEDVEEAWNRSLESMKILGKYAEKKDVLLAYEPLSIYSSNIVNNVKQMKNMIEELNLKNLRGMLDIGQMALANETPKDYVKYLGEKFSHVHLLDATPMGHLALGDGNLPIDEYIDELEKNGYKGKYSFEFTDMNYRHKPEEADIKSIKWLIDHNKLKI